MKKNDFNDLLTSVKEAGQIKKEYDFSKGVRGQFFKAGAKTSSQPLISLKSNQGIATLKT
jgi:hypothetical protein